MSHPSSSDISRIAELSKLLKAHETAEFLTEFGALKFEPFHEPEAAIEVLQRAIALDSNSVDARFWLSKVYFHDHCDYEAARKILEEALRLDPNRADCLCLMASVLRETKSSFEERLAVLKRATELAPDWVMPHRLLADLYRDFKDYPSAYEELEKALSLVGQSGHKTVPRTANEYYERVVTGRLAGPEDVQSLQDALESIHLLKIRQRQSDSFP